jgi:hypothetical protein
MGALAVLATRDELLIGAGSTTGHSKNMLIDGAKAEYFS